MPLRRALVLSTSAILCVAPAAQAIDHDWVNSAGGFFQQTNNWDPVGVPGAGDRAIFNLNGAYTVGFFGGRESSRLLVARDNVTFDLNNFEYLLDGTGGTSLVVGQAGPLGGTGRLTIGEGSVTAQSGAIGTGAGSLVIGGAGSVTVTTGGALRFNGALDVGFTRPGNLIVNGGADLYTVNTTVGLDAAGSASFAGTGSNWNASSWIVVGGRAPGALSVTGGAIVNQFGAGAQGVVGDQSAGSGVVNIDGAGSRWTVPAELYLGNAGDATVNVTNGGALHATATDVFVANLPSATVNVTVGGGDALLLTRTLLFGPGAGSITINAGGRVQTTGVGARVDVSSTGRINLAGGLLQTASLQLASHSRLNWTGGTLHLTAGSLVVNSSGMLGADLTVGAGKTLLVPQLHVASGSITITGGGLVDNSGAVVAGNFLANGTVLVSGAGSTWDVNDLMIGEFGNATLAINAGGTVINNSLSTAGVEIAAASISTSRVTVDGIGSTWNASSIPTGQGFVRVGHRGNGALEITNGGRVTCDFTHANVGSEVGSTGNALVSGAGSAWDVGYFLLVGQMGSGSLTILNGGTVSALSATVGHANTGSGVLTLGGAGSRLDTGTFTIAHAGQATATVGSGAAIDAQRIVMATDTTANANVFITGGTLRAGQSTVMSPRARVQFDAGTFQTGSLQMTGAARVTLAPGRDKIVETSGLSVDAAGGSRIDLADNFLVVDYMMGSPIADVRALILAGHNGGAWDGNGINTSLGNLSTHGIGYAEASDVFTAFPATFAGRSVDNSTVLVAFARYGDANLDGNVTLADFNRLAGHFGQGGDWSDGDFTYDGAVTLSDFNRLASNFGLGAAGPTVTPQDWAALAAAVPEPATGCLALAMLATFARRRRR